MCVIGNGVVVSPEALLDEIDMLVERHIPVLDRLCISGACALILPFHIALDQARELAAGATAIGTTGRGIGPAYEDKVARRALRVHDLYDLDRFDEKLDVLADYHNAALQRVGQTGVDVSAIKLQAREYARRLLPLVCDVPGLIDQTRRAGKRILFEGAQGTMLDVDHGTYPFVTSSQYSGRGCLQRKWLRTHDHRLRAWE